MAPTLLPVGDSRLEVTGVDTGVMAGGMLAVEAEMVAVVEEAEVDESLRGREGRVAGCKTK